MRQDSIVSHKPVMHDSIHYHYQARVREESLDTTQILPHHRHHHRCIANRNTDTFIFFKRQLMLSPHRFVQCSDALKAQQEGNCLLNFLSVFVIF